MVKWKAFGKVNNPEIILSDWDGKGDKKNIDHNSRCPGRDSNWTSPEYKSRTFFVCKSD
jgi:hypothetical protein